MLTDFERYTGVRRVSVDRKIPILSKEGKYQGDLITPGSVTIYAGDSTKQYMLYFNDIHSFVLCPLTPLIEKISK